MTDLLDCQKAGITDLEPFRTLEVGHGIAEICAVAGRPVEDIGSGIHIYRYSVLGGDVRIGVVNDAVLYVDHVAPTGTRRLCGESLPDEN